MFLLSSERFGPRAPDWHHESSQAFLVSPETSQRRPRDKRPGETLSTRPRTHSSYSLMFSQLAGSVIELLYTMFAQCANGSKIKPYDIRDMTSQGWVKSTEMACVKDNLSCIVVETHTHSISLVLHSSRTHTKITFPPVVENEVVHQQPVIQRAHLQPATHTHTRALSLCAHLSSLSAFPLKRNAFLKYALF